MTIFIWYYNIKMTGEFITSSDTGPVWSFVAIVLLNAIAAKDHTDGQVCEEDKKSNTQLYILLQFCSTYLWILKLNLIGPFIWVLTCHFKC